jgi:hypothetical protein
MRARLAGAHRVVRATFAFSATVRGRSKLVYATRRVVLAARHQWILPTDGLFATPAPPTPPGGDAGATGAWRCRSAVDEAGYLLAC